jgi:hypothetical protein
MKAVAVGSKLIMSIEELLKAGDLADQAPLGRALRGYVKAIPDNQLYALLAMMYAGRDGKPDPVAYWDSSIKATVQSRSAAIEMILEKDPGADYIRRAIECLPQGMELDSVPSRVALPL